MQILLYILCAVIAYLLGTIQVGVLISKFYAHTDIRKTGSGNSGTTNVLRTLGWVPSLLTLAGDCLKGVLAACIGRWIGGEIGMLIAGFFAVLGHDFPFYLNFKGGKGIATSLGVTFAICTPVAPWLVVIVVVIVALVHIMSVGTLIASISYPILFWIYMPADANPTRYMIFAVATMLLSFFCHRSNIKRLIKGEENKLNFDKIGKLSNKHLKAFVDRHKK